MQVVNGIKSHFNKAGGDRNAESPYQVRLEAPGGNWQCAFIQDTCGKSGGRAKPVPPCEWAAQDASLVRRCRILGHRYSRDFVRGLTLRKGRCAVIAAPEVGFQEAFSASLQYFLCCYNN